MNNDEIRVRTIADLAALAGVSAGTVSRALSGKGNLVATATRERIQQLADEHGFRININAQNLRLGRTGAISVIFPLGRDKGQPLSDPFFLAMLGYVAEAVAERDCDVVLSRANTADPGWFDAAVRSQRHDGIIVIGQSDQHDALNAAAGLKPFIVWGAAGEQNRYPTVGTDNVAGGRLAADHLVASGRRRLAFFGDITMPEFGQRFSGFRDALPADVQDRVEVISSPPTPAASYHAAVDYFRTEPNVDCIFAASDLMARSVMTAAMEAGRTIPDDLAIIGFDDLPLTQLTTPKITTIRQEIERGAKLLVDLLFQQIEGLTVGSTTLLPTLVPRQSA